MRKQSADCNAGDRDVSCKTTANNEEWRTTPRKPCHRRRNSSKPGSAKPQDFGHVEELCRFFAGSRPIQARRRTMNGIIYLIGLIVVVMAILSFLGLR
jgi:hypothetical protein